MTPTTARRRTAPLSPRLGTVVVALLLPLLAACAQPGVGAGSAGGASTPPDPLPPTQDDGTMSSPDAPEPAPTAPTAPSGEPSVALPRTPAGVELTLVAGPPGAEQAPVTLVCDWVAGTSGGTHPQAEQACADLRAALEAGTDPFAPVPPDAMCTQQYGGDAVVEVTGVVVGDDGTPVDVSAVFTLTDGCQISRFEATGALLAPYRGSV